MADDEATGLTEEWHHGIYREGDVVCAVHECRRRCLQLGFAMTQAVLIATAMSELVRNALYHAGGGEATIRCRPGREPMIELEVRDQGPGIADVERALRNGYSTRGTLGLGLPSVRRIMDGLEIDSAPGRGTVVRAWKRR